MNQIIIGNIVAFIGSIIMVYSGYVKKKEKILLVEIIHNSLFAFSNFILGGITGTVVNVICIARNALCYKKKFSNTAKAILIIISIFFSLMYNKLGIIGFLPLISFILYSLFINTKDIIKFKCLIILIMILWTFHDMYIKSYTSALFDFMTIISNVIALIQIKKGQGIKND